MNARDAIKISIDCGSLVALGYLEDLTDEELLHRPAPGANHINWQLGHLIWSDHHHLELGAPKFLRPLPVGFTDLYNADTASVDDPTKLLTKAELLAAREVQQQATIEALYQQSDEELERETGIFWATTVAALFSMAGSHWLMHAGQWAVIRRQLGRPPLF
jgi:uncharacterized damage-inducible protein DinB